MIPSARAAALRSTALATSLALAVGLAALPAGCLGQAKSSPAEAAADRPQRRSKAHGTDQRARRSPCPDGGGPCGAGRARSCAASSGACDAPACRLAAPAQARGAGSGSRDVLDLAGRQGRAGKRHRAGAQAEARGRHPGAGRDIGSGRPQARGMADPAQRQQWRLRRALSRLHLGQSELAVADLPAPAHRGRAVGRPPRRRHGLVVVRKRIADFGQGQVRAGEGHDRARRSHQCRTAGARGLAQRWHVGRHRERGARSCSARC